MNSWVFVASTREVKNQRTGEQRDVVIQRNVKTGETRRVDAQTGRVLPRR